MNEKLVLDNLKLIYFVINRMQLFDKADYYYDVGLIALIRAAHAFDEGKGYSFSTFATTAIQNEILKDIRVNNADKRKANFNTISLETPVSDEDPDSLLIDLIPSDVDVEKEVIEKMQKEAMYKAIEQLTFNEKAIIKYYIKYDLTQKEIAAITGHSQAYVSRKLQTIVIKLRKIIGRSKKWM